MEHSGELKRVPFGRKMRKYFMLDDEWRNLNHASFGTYPRPVRDALRRFQDEAEAAPDFFLRYRQPKLINESRAVVAKLLNAPTPSIVLVPNATTGTNTFLRNLVYTAKDRILYFSCIYGACEKTVLSITETTPAEAVRIDFTYPVSDDFLVKALEDTVSRERGAGNEVKVAIFDTIASAPGVRMPFEALTATCRKLGVLSCVDGAHGIGHLPIDLTAINPDFFVTNTHKWLFVPRACAVMYVPDRNQKLIRTSFPTSHGFVPLPQPGEHVRINNPLPPAESEATPFTTQFEYMGTVDRAPDLCIPAAVRFRDKVCGGEAEIMAYCMQLARTGGAHVAKMLGTEVLDNEEGTLTKECLMVNVRLPLVRDAIDIGGSGEVGLVHWMSRVVINDFKSFIPFMWYGGSWWARLAAQVYLELDDFAWAGTVLGQVCERVRNGEHLLGAQ